MEDLNIGHHIRVEQRQLVRGPIAQGSRLLELRVPLCMKSVGKAAQRLDLSRNFPRLDVPGQSISVEERKTSRLVNRDIRGAELRNK